MFAGAGPVGENFKLTVFNYTSKDEKPLTSADIIEPVFTDEDMGGYADLAGAQKFTDGSSSTGGSVGGSSGGCDAGFGFLAVGLALLFAVKSKRQ